MGQLTLPCNIQMVNVRRQRLKAIRSGVPVDIANKATSQEELIKLMEENHNKKQKNVNSK